MMVFIVLTAVIGAVAAWRLAMPFLKTGQAGAGRLASLVMVPVVLLGALGFYFVNGEPETPGAPYAEVAQRLADTNPEELTSEEQEARLRAILRENPEDVQALRLVAPPSEVTDDPATEGLPRDLTFDEALTVQ